MRLARIERLDGHFPECEACLNEAAALHGSASEETQLEWLLLRCQKGEVDEVAPGLLYAANNGHADAAAIFLTVARSLADRGRLGEAHTCLDMWLKCNPDAAIALDLRGYIAYRLNHPESALKDYQRALELDPERAGVRLRLVDLYLAEANPGAAEAHIDYLRKTRPADVNVRSMNARYLLLMGHTDDALAILEQLNNENPNHVATLLIRAKAELQQNKPVEAEKWCRRVLEINPCDTEAHYTLYRSLQAQPGRAAEGALHKKRKEELTAIFEKINVIVTAPPARMQQPDQMAELGELFLAVGLDSNGLQWLYTALQIVPNHVAANNALANYYEKQQRPEKAKLHRAAARAAP
jgi:tetratricopeptide (TPR) repeat protein